MLYFFSGTDTEKTRGALAAAIENHLKEGGELFRITDVHTREDLSAALGGPGLFGGRRVIVLDSLGERDDLWEVVIAGLPGMKKGSDVVLVYESLPDSASRKQIEKHAEASVRYDSAKLTRRETIFALGNALQAGKKKELWVGYQRERAAGKSPEAIHGVLFWAVKQLVLRNPRDARARVVLSTLAQLPHEARRNGEELEYALERFALAQH